ncbi:N-methylhydantoinase A/acetone carboxylase, beta subunit [Desulfosporosinus orientis DSM 765]|uniref:N-methylhydantoinase A/acetone carboxylase, beta subunit n=1 Tax=Desulfosporosinus orientis (strain ATCC 19365 / DSM 765 / NCIMB 8382 / VKM B-1628 / Singapore I) TaxID=768706 RepID=G7W6Y6_DESOD|nr:hydantoinase/oxoprolinase family protein [Desulfosporosinus orientis]AET69843.1 N-methylhydantoinase A/acetone carboxylase, beta subunit [Desulfosporosinus orientis DSM 765]
MQYGLGIDTGGTYTDAVIFDFENNKVISTAKSITVKEDLTIGINGALSQIPQEMITAIMLVSLSTTLATNACIEGKGCRAKLVLIGFDEDIVAKYGHEYGLPEKAEIIFLSGGSNQQGEITYEPDWDFLKTKVENCNYIIDTFAVVELWGVRNSNVEKKAKALLNDWTGKQVVCGHELTDELNSLKRAASALINVQLIPIINDFINAVKISLKHMGIEAPLVIVRGDGSLMSEKFARDKPMETLLCGPAASVAGAINLTREENCIVVDMGGTTSDIALVKDGNPEIAIKGARIGKWNTGIKSILINTVGLGGDSLIRHNNQNTLNIGPDRAAPLSWLACRWPSVLEKIETIYRYNRKHTISLCEFFYKIRDISEDAFYNQEERNIVTALANGPLSLTELTEMTDTTIYSINLKRLEKHGIVMRCSLTPTDIMHLTGEFTDWNKEAAYYGAMIMANQINVHLEELIEIVNEKIKERLYFNIVNMILEHDEAKMMSGGMSEQLSNLINSSFKKNCKLAQEKNDTNDIIAYSFSTRLKLVGIGAPTHIYLPGVAETLNTSYIVPKNAGVANAIGAITGNVMVEEKIIIIPKNGFIGYSTFENKKFTKHSDAVEWAETKVYEMAKTSAQLRGAVDVEIFVTVHNNEVEVFGVSDENVECGVKDSSNKNSIQSNKIKADESVSQKNKLLIETIVTARAVGNIFDWNKQKKIREEFQWQRQKFLHVVRLKKK